MTQRTTRSRTISNDEIGILFRLRSLLPHRNGHQSHFPTAASSLLYSACQNNDLTRVESCLQNMKREEIDYQHLPNNETALHIAVRNKHTEIIKTLLNFGAQRSIRNRDGHQPCDLAETQEIKDLFKRPKSYRFVFLQNTCKPTTIVPHKIKCESCSLVNDSTFYEWELVDRNASQKALRFRRELKAPISMNERTLKQKLYSIKKGYINARLPDISTQDGKSIHEYYKRALLQHDPFYIITAFTISQSFSKLLNTDMARNVIHDLKNGCSKFSCDCLYSTEDGTKSITNILLHHPKFQELSFKGEVYRGIIVPKNALDHYKVSSCIITTTFLSTSINPAVARAFCDKGKPNPDTHSFFCIYEILTNNRTAINISKISEYKDEDEILLLPYSAFLITKIEEGEETTNIYLKEQCLTHMFGNNESQECSLESSLHLLELVGSTLLHNTNEILLAEDDCIRPRSKTMPELKTQF